MPEAASREPTAPEPNASVSTGPFSPRQGVLNAATAGSAKALATPCAT